MTTTYEIHPAADLFPMMSPDEFEGLKNDIREHGQREDIHLLDGKILDGRNRYRACQDLGIEPQFCEMLTKEMRTDDDPVAYVLSRNLHRRHLDKSQLAIVAAKARALYDSAAKERRKRKPTDSVVERVPQQNGKSRDICGKAVGVSGKSVDAATRILKSGNVELIAAVEQGKTTLRKATKRLDADVRRATRQASAETRVSDSGIILGDFRQLAETIEDGSIDLIFTDPPYDTASVPLYGDLAKFAAAKLAPGGWMITYSGNLFLPQILASMTGRGMSYGWTFCCLHSGGNQYFRNLALWNGWKPIFGFFKPPLSVDWPAFDDVVSGGREKGDHPWQQAESEAAYFIDKLCCKSGIVCDPFCGSGTSLAAAKRLGRRWIGCEINPEHVETARARIESVDMAVELKASA